MRVESAARQYWVGIMAVPLTSQVNPDNILHLSQFLFRYLYNEDNVNSNES